MFKYDSDHLRNLQDALVSLILHETPSRLPFEPTHHSRRTAHSLFRSNAARITNAKPRPNRKSLNLFHPRAAKP
jgi:hypothetical protein